MSFTAMNDDMEIISKLGDEPNEDDGLSASALKALFDKAGTLCKTAINRLIDELGRVAAAASIGFRRSENVPADTVQAAIENVQAQVREVTQSGVANNSITNEKLVNNQITSSKVVKDDFLMDVTAEVGLTLVSSDAAETESHLKFYYIKAIGIVLVRGYVLVTPTAARVNTMFSMTAFKPISMDDNDSLYSKSNDVLVNWIDNDVYHGRLAVNGYNCTVGQSQGLPVNGWYFCEGA